MSRASNAILNELLDGDSGVTIASMVGPMQAPNDLMIEVAGESQEVYPANPERRGLFIWNTSDTIMWFNELGPASPTPPSMPLMPGAYFRFPKTPLTALNIFCAIVAKQFTAREW